VSRDTIPLPDRPRRNADCAYREIGDEGGLVVLPGRSEVKVLNPVGLRIYSLLDGTRTVDEIVEAVTAEFAVSAEDAREDVRVFLGELAAQGMLGA
jgi:hypothetical protein